MSRAEGQTSGKETPSGVVRGSLEDMKQADGGQWGTEVDQALWDMALHARLRRLKFLENRWGATEDL